MKTVMRRQFNGRSLEELSRASGALTGQHASSSKLAFDIHVLYHNSTNKSLYRISCCVRKKYHMRFVVTKCTCPETSITFVRVTRGSARSTELSECRLVPLGALETEKACFFERSGLLHSNEPH
jgi:hypothetical protein